MDDSVTPGVPRGPQVGADVGCRPVEAARFHFLWQKNRLENIKISVGISGCKSWWLVDHIKCWSRLDQHFSNCVPRPLLQKMSARAIPEVALWPNTFEKLRAVLTTHTVMLTCQAFKSKDPPHWV